MNAPIVTHRCRSHRRCTTVTTSAQDRRQELKPRSELTAAELLREVGAVLRMSEAEAAQLGDLPEPTPTTTRR